MTIIYRLLLCSNHIQELDLESNLIGDIGGQILVRALLKRGEGKL